MNGKLRKITSLLLAACLILSLALTGCTSKEEESSSASQTDSSSESSSSSQTSQTSESSQESQAQTNADRERVTIDVLQYAMNMDNADYSKDRIKQKIEETVNVDLDYKTYAGEVYDQNLELDLLSGKAPALFHNWGQQDKTGKWIDDGVLFNMGEFVAQNPDRYPILNAMFQCPEWKMYNEFYSGDPDSTYAIYALAFKKFWSGGIDYNAKILKEAGWEDTPKTVDEFVQYCKDVKALGYTPWFPRNYKMTNLGIFNAVFGSTYGTNFLPQSGGITDGMMQQQDGTWVCTTVSDESRAAIEKIHQLYVDGGLPQTLGSEEDYGPIIDQFNADKVGAVSYFINDASMYNWLLNSTYRKTHPDATVNDVVIGNLLQGPAGYATNTAASYWMGENWMIPKSCEHPDRVLDLIEYLATKEGQDLVHKGIEGIHYVNDENGRPVFNKDEWLVETAMYGQGDGRCFYPWFVYLFSGMQFELDLENGASDWFNTSKNGDTFVVETNSGDENLAAADVILKEQTEKAFIELPPYYVVVSFTDEENEMRAKLKEVFLEYVPSFITGAKDIDAEWDQYVADYKAAGSDQITEAMNKAVSAAQEKFESYSK